MKSSAQVPRIRRSTGICIGRLRQRLPPHSHGLIPGDTLAHSLVDIAYRTAATTATTGNGDIVGLIEPAVSNRRQSAPCERKPSRSMAKNLAWTQEDPSQRSG